MPHPASRSRHGHIIGHPIVQHFLYHTVCMYILLHIVRVYVSLDCVIKYLQADRARILSPGTLCSNTMFYHTLVQHYLNPTHTTQMVNIVWLKIPARRSRPYHIVGHRREDLSAACVSRSLSSLADTFFRSTGFFLPDEKTSRVCSVLRRTGGGGGDGVFLGVSLAPGESRA